MTEGPGYNPPPPGSSPGGSFPPPGGYGSPPPFGGYGTPPPGYGGYSAYGSYPPYGRPTAPKPGLVPLRPLTAGEILDGAFSSIRWNPKTVLGSSAIVAAAAGVVTAVVTLVLQHDVFTNVVSPSNGVTLTSAQLGKYLGLIFATLGVTLVLAFVARTILIGILTVAIGQGVLGRKETLHGAWRAARSGLWRLVGTILLKYLLLFGGLILAIAVLGGVGAAVGVGAHAAPLGILIGVLGGVPAIIFFAIVTVRWSLAIPITMLERTRPLKSLGRSWRLVKGSWWRILGISLATAIIVGIAGEIIQVPFRVVAGGGSLLSTQHSESMIATIVIAIGGIIAQTVTSPMTAGVTVLLYADMRMRREGLDIALQAAAAPPGGGPVTHPGRQPGTQRPPGGDPSWSDPSGPRPGSLGPGSPSPPNPGSW